MAAKKASGRKPKGGWSIPIDDLGKAVQKALVQLYGKGGAKTVARMYKAGKTVQVPTVAQRAAASAEKKASKAAAARKAALARDERTIQRRARDAARQKGVDKTMSRIEVNDALANSEAYRSMRQAGMTKRRATSVRAQKDAQKDVNKLSGGLKKNWSRQREEQLGYLKTFREARRAGDSKTADAAKKKYDKSVEKYGRWEK